MPLVREALGLSPSPLRTTETDGLTPEGCTLAPKLYCEETMRRLALNWSVIEVGALVLYARDIGRTSKFYRALGIPLDYEDHGEGQVHFATELGRVHFAVYSATSGGVVPPRHSAGDSFHGFFVDSLENVRERLKAVGVKQLSGHERMPWGCRFVVEDPDGRAVEINQRRHCPAEG